MKRIMLSRARSVVAIALASCAVLTARPASGQEFDERLILARPSQVESRATKLRAQAQAGDTTFVGFTPGRFDPAKNWWSIGAGYSPPNSNTPAFLRPFAGQGGMWDFEPTGGSYLHGDTLQGWWPDRQLMNGTGGLTRPDWNRPWWAVENGNKANYVLPGSTRTYGVVGVWHRDDFGAPSDGGPNGPAITPIGGSFSAWMGLRRDGDNRFVDPITGNPFNSRVMQLTAYGAASVSGSDNGFPGYGSQMDQMLYRDIDMSGHVGSDLTIRYSYRLRMSTGFGNVANTRTGWFDKDPLQIAGGGASNQAIGNFISSTDAGDVNAPRDSFTVYVGAPVGSTFLASTGVTMAVYDPLRRWFDEVVRCNEPGLWKQLDRDTGRVDLRLRSVTIPNSILAPMLAASSGRLRLVFRVHTNRGFDDQGTAYSSGRAGAAVVDDVSYQIVGGPASPAGWGDFESPTAIDNGIGTDAVSAWKSTGKPPQPYSHVHSLADLRYEDLCGQPGDISRICNMWGVVASLGDHDQSEAAAGLVDGTADRELWIGMVSPTVQLRSDNGSWPNPIGLRDPALGGAQDPHASGDYWVNFDLYSGAHDPFTDGILYRFGVQSYPAADRNGSRTWGNLRTPPAIFFNPNVECFREWGMGLDQGAMLRWATNLSESPSFPDSVRLMIGHRSECYRFGVSMGCAPTDGSYWDNISLAIIDEEPDPISASPWDWFQDTFPANETAGIPGDAARFDTTSAYVKAGVNVAQTTGNVNRWSVPGDSVTVSAWGSATPGLGHVRVDMVFRILPGPGNYLTIGRPDLGTLRRVPTLAAPIAGPVFNSSNFWESYLAHNGAKGTPGGHAGGVWDPNVWNSARCDTMEGGAFAFQSRAILGGPADKSLFDSQYHESELNIAPNPAHADPYPTVTYRSALGVSRHRCYLASPAAIPTAIDCVHDAGTTGAGWDLTYLTGAGSGFDLSPDPGWPANPNFTVEKTKIIPDGLLTPGAHVQYFFRSENGGVIAGMLPDTNLVAPQPDEWSDDGHRWQQFGVLPDRWKDAAYRHPVTGAFGAGQACMLVVDNNDRRGNELAWVSLADSIGLTRSDRYGAHNGWHARGDQSVNDPAGFVSAHLGQAGTSWDLYQVKGSESLNTNSGSIGSRLSFRDPANTQIHGKTSRLGPTPEMLEAYYRSIVYLSGDLNSGILGPFQNKSANDAGILTDWLAAGDPSAPDRFFWAIGNGFVESNARLTLGVSHDDFNQLVLGVTLRNASYRIASGNSEVVPDLLPSAGGPLVPFGDQWGVRNICRWTNDVLDRSAALFGETVVLAEYEPSGSGPFPLANTVLKQHTPARPWIAAVTGVDLEHLVSRFGDDTRGRNRFVQEMLTGPLGAVALCPAAGFPPLDVPTTDGVLTEYVRFANNPLRAGPARIEFALATTDRVTVRIHDVAGRLVRTLARREFPAGEHVLRWDGADDHGTRLARGVYFARLERQATGREVTSKIVVLR